MLTCCGVGLPPEAESNVGKEEMLDDEGDNDEGDWMASDCIRAL